VQKNTGHPFAIAIENHWHYAIYYQATAEGANTMPKIFFDNHNFRAYLVYRALGAVGGGLFSITMIWIMHSSFQSPFYTGLAGFMFVVTGAASFIIGPYVDKRNKAVLIRVLSFVQLCIMGILLGVYVFFSIQPWVLLLAILLYDAAATVKAPASTAILPSIVKSDDLVNANVTLQTTSTAVALGVGVFLFSAMDYIGFDTILIAIVAAFAIAVIASLFIKSGEPEYKPDETKNYFTELKIGFAFIKKGVMSHLILVLLFISMVANIVSVNLPMFAEMHVGASGYILLMLISGVGAMIGPYIAKQVESKLTLFNVFVIGFILTGIMRIVFVHVIADNFSRAIGIYILYVAIGSAIGVFIQTLMQKLPPKNIIARVNAIRISIISIVAAIGALLGGVLGTVVDDVDTIFIIQGVLYIVFAAGICFSKHLRRLPKVGDVEGFE